VTSWKSKRFSKITSTIKFIPISIPRLRAHFAGILWRKGPVLMVTNASLLTGLPNSNATMIIRCHIKLDLAMLSQGNGSAPTALGAISCIETRTPK